MQGKITGVIIVCRGPCSYPYKCVSWPGFWQSSSSGQWGLQEVKPLPAPQLMVPNMRGREQSWICASVGVGPSSPCPGVPSFWFVVPAFGFRISIAPVCCLNFSCLTTFTGELALHSLIQSTSQFIAHTTESFNWIYICLDSTCQCGMNLHQVQLSFTEVVHNPCSKCSKTGILVPPWRERKLLWSMAVFFPMPFQCLAPSSSCVILETINKVVMLGVVGFFLLICLVVF